MDFSIIKNSGRRYLKINLKIIKVIKIFFTFSGDVQLDHCKLYVKNISKALNEDGLRAVFEKYATKVRVFLSRDPKKRYAIASFDSPG